MLKEINRTILGIKVKRINKGRGLMWGREGYKSKYNSGVQIVSISHPESYKLA